jgi:rhodanese-related sulfurtransferase
LPFDTIKECFLERRKNMATSITVTELKNKIAEGAKIHVIDVRRLADYEKMSVTIAEAPWENPENVEDWSLSLPVDQEVVVYCVKGGSVSQSVADVIAKHHSNIRFLEGGILKWQGGIDL